jgi:CspA family cold shock protein
MQRGTIKKLVSDKGFGFIAGQTRGKDLFFHLSALQDLDFDSLYEGQEVEYESEDGPKGARASVVRPLNS